MRSCATSLSKFERVTVCVVGATAILHNFATSLSKFSSLVALGE